MVIIIVALTVIPTIYLAMQEGIAAVDGNLCEMARVYRLSRRKRLMGIYLPAVSAPLLSASVVALGGGMRVPSWGKPSERHMGSASPLADTVFHPSISPGRPSGSQGFSTSKIIR